MKKRFIIKTLLLVNLVLLFTVAFISPVSAQELQSLRATETQSAGAIYIGGQYAVCDDAACTNATINQNNSQLDALAWGLLNRIQTTNIPLYTQDGQPVTASNGTPVYVQRSGAIAGVMNYSNQMYLNPPASGVVYAQQEWNKITKGYVAHAQDAADESWVYYPGLGFNILNPVQDFWILARNIAYLAMIIIIIVVAFLVAFRSNFGGQTQVTIANSIPNIVIALIMITISYPLSGLAIDLITIGSNFTQQILIQNDFSPGHYLWTADHLDRLGPADDLENPRYHLQPDDEAMSVWQSFLTADVNVVEGDGGVASVIPRTEVLGDIVDNVLKSLENDATNLLVQLVFVIAAFMASLKLFFKLIGKYLILILYPAVSPFVMLTVAIPGQGTKAIAKYFKTLLAASLGFVAVYAVFLFMVVIGHHPTFGDQLSLTPPLLGYSPEQQGQAGEYIKMILAFALFLTTPVIPDMVDQALDTLPAYAEKMAPGQRIKGAMLGGPRYGGGGVVGGFLGANNLVTTVAQKTRLGGNPPKK